MRSLGEWEQHVIDHWLRREPVSQNTNEVFGGQLTFGERVADAVAAFGGSWTFIFLFLGAMGVWMAMNLRSTKPFDPFPFILLNLVLSCLAALQAPVIMMSQNRQAAKDRLDAQHDYEVNLKAEVEVLALHTKLDELRDKRLARLEAMLEEQAVQLARLETLIRDSGPARESSRYPT